MADTDNTGEAPGLLIYLLRVTQWLETNRKVTGSNSRLICPVFEVRIRSEQHLD